MNPTGHTHGKSWYHIIRHSTHNQAMADIILVSTLLHTSMVYTLSAAPWGSPIRRFSSFFMFPFFPTGHRDGNIPSRHNINSNYASIFLMVEKSGTDGGTRSVNAWPKMAYQYNITIWSSVLESCSYKNVIFITNNLSRYCTGYILTYSLQSCIDI